MPTLSRKAVAGPCEPETLPGHRALLARAARLAWLLARHSTRYVGQCLPHGRPRRQRRLDQFGLCVASFCDEAGPAFTKLGQVLATRHDLLPPALTTPLRRLHDRAAPAAIPDVEAHVAGALRCDLRQHVAAIEPTPFAAASIAQLYRATLRSGGRMAIKVRRPGIVPAVTADLRLVKLLCTIVARLPGGSWLPIEAVGDEVCTALARQLDLRLEAEHFRRLRHNFRSARGVRIPRVFPHLSGESILTIELIEPLRPPTELHLEPAARKRVATLGLRSLYKMIFVDGFVHADLHRANLFFRRDEIVIVDLGLVAVLTAEQADSFSRFFLAMVENDGKGCADLLWEIALAHSPACDRQAFTADIAALVAFYSGRAADQFNVAEFAGSLFAIQRRHRIRGSAEHTMAIVALLTYEGLVSEIYRHLDFQAEAQRFLGRRPGVASA